MTLETLALFQRGDKARREAQALCRQMKDTVRVAKESLARAEWRLEKRAEAHEELQRLRQLRQRDAEREMNE
jgi:hypothetical protein